MSYTPTLTNFLSPGGYISFNVSPFDGTSQINNQVASYALIIQTNPPTVTVSPSPEPTSSLSPVPTATVQLTPTPSPGTSSAPINLFYVSIAAVVVFLFAALAAVFVLRKRSDGHARMHLKTSIKPQAEQPVLQAAPKPLSDEDKRKLEDIWFNEFYLALGRVPPHIDSVFRVKLEEVKNMPYEEAKKAVLSTADEIIARTQGASE